MVCLRVQKSGPCNFLEHSIDMVGCEHGVGLCSALRRFNIIHANEDPAAVVARTDNATSTTEQNIMASSDDLYGKLPVKLSELC